MKCSLHLQSLWLLVCVTHIWHSTLLSEKVLMTEGGISHEIQLQQMNMMCLQVQSTFILRSLRDLSISSYLDWKSLVHDNRILKLSSSSYSHALVPVLHWQCKLTGNLRQKQKDKTTENTHAETKTHWESKKQLQPKESARLQIIC